MSSSVPTESTVNVDDIFVPVFGITGAGKSSFIESCTGQSKRMVGHSLESYTAGVSMHTIHCQDRVVHLVDTPGFDDSRHSDVKTLELLAFWLVQAYRQGIRLGGVIYLHRITDNRLSSSGLKSLNVFKQICGAQNFPGVTLATTRWDLIKDPHTRANAHSRLQQLETYFWADMISEGARVRNLNPNTCSPLAIVEELVTQRNFMILQLQSEMGDESKALRETSAGQILFQSSQEDIQRIEAKLVEATQSFEDAMRKHHDRNIIEFRREMRNLQESMDSQNKEMNSLDRSIQEITQAQMDKAKKERKQLRNMIAKSATRIQQLEKERSQQLERARRRSKNESKSKQQETQIEEQLHTQQFDDRKAHHQEGQMQLAPAQTLPSQAQVQAQPAGQEYREARQQHTALQDALRQHIASKSITAPRVGAAAGVASVAVGLMTACAIM